MIKVFSDKTNFLRVIRVLILAFAVIDSSGGRGFAVSNVRSAFVADYGKSAANHSASRSKNSHSRFARLLAAWLVYVPRCSSK